MEKALPLYQAVAQGLEKGVPARSTVTSAAHDAKLGEAAVAACGSEWAAKQGFGHGERSRSQLLPKLAGAENGLILAVNGLAVNGLAVNGALHALYIVSKSVLYTL